MDESKYILADDELLDLSESVPLTEGGLLEDLLEEAQQVAGAINRAGVDPSSLDSRARALLFMRGFYFLGVLRGGEAYRATLLDELSGADEPPTAQFELSECCTDMFARELEGEPTETVKAVYEAVGLADADKEGAKV